MLEAVARDVAAAWGVELGEPFALALHSFAAPADADAVLKVVPERTGRATTNPTRSPTGPATARFGSCATTARAGRF